MKGRSIKRDRMETTRMDDRNCRSEFATDLNMNESNYRGLLFRFTRSSDRIRGICGDSNLVIMQMRGEIDKVSILQAS